MATPRTYDEARALLERQDGEIPTPSEWKAAERLLYDVGRDVNPDPDLFITYHAIAAAVLLRRAGLDSRRCLENVLRLSDLSVWHESADLAACAYIQARADLAITNIEYRRRNLEDGYRIVVVDLIRELEKAQEVLAQVNRMMSAEAEMNAAKHMSGTVMPNPLASAVAAVHSSIGRKLEEAAASEEALAEQGLANKIVSKLGASDTEAADQMRAYYAGESDEAPDFGNEPEADCGDIEGAPV